jgi:diaphanous 1
VAPLISKDPVSLANAQTERHFSIFPLTSHLHTPTLRLVSLHPFLVLQVSFLRVPEIHDGFQWKIFISKSSTAKDIIDTAVCELGLTKSLPIPGAGALEYVLEEVWTDGSTERKTSLHSLNTFLILHRRISSHSFGQECFSSR